MPVRPLSLSILKWPDAKVVDDAVRGWAAGAIAKRTGVLRFSYFGC